jgi:hypothetical protein
MSWVVLLSFFILYCFIGYASQLADEREKADREEFRKKLLDEIRNTRQ